MQQLRNRSPNLSLSRVPTMAHPDTVVRSHCLIHNNPQKQVLHNSFYIESYYVRPQSSLGNMPSNDCWKAGDMGCTEK